jgi:hypothetical protein
MSGLSRPMRRSRLRPVSATRARLLRQRREIVARAEPEACPRCHLEPVVDVHELVRRSQRASAAADIEVMQPLCRTCHDWVGAHPRQAVEDGWAMWSWQDPRRIDGSR